MKHNEEWKPVLGWPKEYLVSNFGRVMSIKYGNKKIMKSRTIGKSINNKGWKPYQQVVLYKEGKQHTKMIHRLVAEAFLKNVNNKPEVNHLDNDVKNNCVTNLEWVTRSENVLYTCRVTGRDNSHCAKNLNRVRPKGEKHHDAKITMEKANEIRSKYIPNVYSLNKLAKEYDLSKKSILLIIQNKTWKHEKIN